MFERSWIVESVAYFPPEYYSRLRFTAILRPSVVGYFDFVIPSAFSLARGPALRGAEGNLLFLQ
jgi:hypothetical protein